jgi:tRNA 2-thiouridine synthesizing protein B
MSNDIKMLHTVNKSPFERNSLESCLRLAKDGSAVLLIEDAVYGALLGTSVSDRVAARTGNLRVCVLGADLNARGLADKPLIDGVEIVDYGGFVDLACEHDTVQSWL